MPDDTQNLKPETGEAEPEAPDNSDKPVKPDTLDRSDNSTAREAIPDLMADTGPIPDKPPFKVIRDDFKPYYKSESRYRWLAKAVQYVLLVALGLGLIGLVAEAFLRETHYRLEAAVIIVIVVALLGFLWKTLSIEVRSGLVAVAVGLLTALAYTAFNAEDFGGLFVSRQFFLPGFYALCLCAGIVAAWRLKPRVHWLPAALTVLLLYAAVAPVFALIEPSPNLSAVFAGPAFMADWPVYLQPGWLLAQVFLPLGAALLIVLQFRTLFRPQFDSHWGFIYWAVALILVAYTGLGLLETAGRPVFPRARTLTAQIYPRAMPAPAMTAAVPAPAAKSPIAPVMEKKLPEPAPVSPVPAPPVAPPVPKQAEALPPAVSSDQIAILMAQIQTLQEQFAQMRTQLDEQNRLISVLTELVEKLAPPEEPVPPAGAPSDSLPSSGEDLVFPSGPMTETPDLPLIQPGPGETAPEIKGHFGPGTDEPAVAPGTAGPAPSEPPASSETMPK